MASQEAIRNIVSFPKVKKITPTLVCHIGSLDEFESRSTANIYVMKPAKILNNLNRFGIDSVVN